MSARCIYRIIPTPSNQLFVLSQVSPLSRLSLLIRVGVRIGVCVGVQPTAADPPLRDGVVPTIEVVKCEPRSPSHEEAAVQVEGAGLLLILVSIYTLRTGE